MQDHAVKFIEKRAPLKEKKLHNINQGSSFLRGRFSNIDNVRTSIQLSQHNI